MNNYYPKILIGYEAAKFVEGTHIGSPDEIPIGNLAVRAAISEQRKNPQMDVFRAIYKAYNE